MTNTLEGLTENYSSEDYISGNSSKNLEGLTGENISICADPVLNKFTCSIKDKKRRKEIESEIKSLYNKYVEDLKKYSGAPGRAALLEQSYHFVPSENEIEEGKDIQGVLKNRLYSNPGRNYQYLNGIVGEKKKSKDIKGEIGKAAKYAIKEGWPVLGAGAGWMLMNRFAKKTTFDNKWWQYLVPGIGPARLGVDAGKMALKGAWGLIKTPALYAIGAYAAYKVIKYFLRRRKEKRLEHEEVERLENLRNEMASQKQMFYLHQGAVAGAAA